MVLIFSICNIFIKKMIREGNLFVKKVPTMYCKFSLRKILLLDLDKVSLAIGFYLRSKNGLNWNFSYLKHAA